MLLLQYQVLLFEPGHWLFPLSINWISLRNQPECVVAFLAPVTLGAFVSISLLHCPISDSIVNVGFISVMTQ